MKTSKVKSKDYSFNKLKCW